MSANLMEELSRQVERVATIRERYRRLEGMPQIDIRPAVHIMGAALLNAHKAAGGGDIIEIARAIEDLKGFEE